MIAFADTVPVPTTSSQPGSVTLIDNGTIKQLRGRLLLSESFRSAYTTPITHALVTFGYAKAPFLAKWNLEFINSYTNVGPLPIDECARDLNLHCSDSICGGPCTNSITTIKHHKNNQPKI